MILFLIMCDVNKDNAIYIAIINNKREIALSILTIDPL